jgi:hypothetical protein
MGLDITAYKNLKKVENPKLDESGYPVNWENQWKPGGSMEWSESVWPGKGYPVDPDAVYGWGEEFNFRAGSYSGYNSWRAELNNFKGGTAFQEMIDFADNEGVIGSELSKKLYDDFMNNLTDARAYAKTLGCDAEWFMDKYMDWLKAFEFASENGAVDFH